MVNQQKGVRQETAYSAMIICIPVPISPKGVIETGKNDIGRDGDTIHYNCTIGRVLLHSFLLIYHPYPPSFHEMIFILVDHVWFL